MLRSCVLGWMMMAVPAAALAGSEPDVNAVKSVVNYYYDGKAGSPLLVESKLCQGVHAKGEQKNECSAELKTIHAETDVLLWLNFMVPLDSSSTHVLIQFDHEGTTRMTRELSLQSAMRFRAWKKVRFDRPGNWKIKILLDKREKPSVLTQIPIQVGDAQPKLASTNR